MKKIISLLLVLAMSAMMFASCNKQTDIPEGMQLVENDFANYKLFVPTDWTPSTAIDGFLTAKAGDNSNFSVQTMTWDNRYTSTDEYFRKDYLTKLISTFKNVTLLEDECAIENITVGTAKNSAVKYVYTVESDGAVYKHIQYFSYNAGYLYMLTYTGKISDTVNGEVKEVSYFADHLEELTAIVENFVF